MCNAAQEYLDSARRGGEVGRTAGVPFKFLFYLHKEQADSVDEVVESGSTDEGPLQSQEMAGHVYCFTAIWRDVHSSLQCHAYCLSFMVPFYFVLSVENHILLISPSPWTCNARVQFRDTSVLLVNRLGCTARKRFSM